MKVLVADDNPFFSRMLQTTLEEWGYEVCRVSDGTEAWQVLQHKDGPRLAILDWVMPGLDGLELCRRLRAREEGRGVYILVLTSKNSRQDAIAALQAGADDFVSKPFQREELQARLQAGKRIVGLQAELAEKVVELEGALSGAQKLEAIGRLAGGVAHDFNNLLTIINGFSEFLRQTLPAGDHRRDMVDEIAKAGERGAGLTRQLLAFSRRQVLQPCSVQLNELLANLQKMLRRLIGEDIEFHTDLDPVLGCIHADPGQIEQVIMNLAVNARDAMPAGGTLRIETRNVVRPAPGRSDPLPYVVLTVTDTGHGMDDETRQHIFEPFFTTKEPGKGTGLGLATVYGITRQTGGFIEVESAPGQGASFKVFLPETPAGKVPQASMPCPVPRHGAGETILLVEDEASVRKMVRDILQLNNYRILEAGDGLEALEVCRRHRAPIDLLLTDIVMPRMGGHALAEHLCEHLPGLRVLYMSGYPSDVNVHQDLTRSGRPFLPKPFTPLTLTEKVSEALRRERTGLTAAR